MFLHSSLLQHHAMIWHGMVRPLQRWRTRTLVLTYEALMRSILVIRQKGRNGHTYLLQHVA